MQDKHITWCTPFTGLTSGVIVALGGMPNDNDNDNDNESEFV